MKTIASAIILATAIPCLCEWHEQDAKYRIEADVPETASAFGLDISDIVFPDNIENGVAVRSADGEKLPHHLDKDGGMLFCGSPGDGPAFIYFGFPSKHQDSDWDEKKHGPIPENQRLQLRSTRAWFDKTTESEMMKNPQFLKYMEIRKIENEIAVKEMMLARAMAATRTALSDGMPDHEEAPDPGLEILRAEIAETKKILKEKTKELGLQDQDIRNFKNKEQRLERNFSPKQSRREFETREMAETRLRRETLSDKKKEHACRLQGMLMLEKEGEYQFAVNSEGLSMITIDDATIVSWPFIHTKSDGWTHAGTIHLPPGKYTFRFYAQIEEKSDFAEAAWKKPGDHEFSILKDTDFIVPPKASIKSCSDSEGTSIPIVKARLMGRIFSDRTRSMDLYECRLVESGLDISPDWEYGPILVKNETWIQFLAEDGSEPEITMRYEQPGTYTAERKIKLAKIRKSNDVIEPEIEMDMNIPNFIFDDENLGMQSVIYSLVPNSLRAQLRTSSVPENSVFPKSSEWISLPAKAIGDEIYSPPESILRQFPLDGSKLAETPLHIRFSLSIPPLDIVEKNASFVPLGKCPGLVCEDGVTLRDTRGHRIVPVLHRPTLAEKRSWSFASSIADEIIGGGKTMVVSDEFGTGKDPFSKHLRISIGKKTPIEFIPWPDAGSGSSMLKGLPDVIAKLATTNASRILLIPSSLDIRRGVPARTQSRIICAALQTARANRSVRNIVICTPIPLENENQIEEELAREMKTNTRQDFAVNKVIDLSSFVREQHNWRSYYRQELNSPAIKDIHPTHMVEQIAQFIADSI